LLENPGDSSPWNARPPSAASGSGACTRLMTPPIASGPYNTLAGPRTSSIRSAKPGSTAGA
jgi:hypothetical protein